MSIKNKIIDSITDYLNLVKFGIVTVIAIAAAIMITFNRFTQSVDAQTSQDMYRLGYYSGCHDAPSSMNVTRMSYIHFSNTSNLYPPYNEGYNHGITDELDGLCSPDLLSQIDAGSNNDTNPFYIYESESMAPIFHKDDLIVANYNNTNFNDSKFEDIIIFKATDPAEHNKIIVTES